MIKMRTIHAAVLGKQISHATRNLTTDSHSAVSIFHPATLDDDILRWDVETPAVSISSRLDRNAIVTSIEFTIFNQHTVTRFRITTIVVWTMTADLHAAHGNVAAQYRMYLPHR